MKGVPKLERPSLFLIVNMEELLRKMKKRAFLLLAFVLLMNLEELPPLAADPPDQSCK
jgi:hypothetical protein